MSQAVGEPTDASPFHGSNSAFLCEEMVGEQRADDFPRPLSPFAHLVVARIEAEDDSRDRGVEQARIAREIRALEAIGRSPHKSWYEERTLSGSDVILASES